MDLYEDIFSSGLRGSPSSNKPPTDYENKLKELNEDIEEYRIFTDPDTTELLPDEIVEETDLLIAKLQKFYNATPPQLRNKYPLYTSLDTRTNRIQNYEDFFKSLQKRKTINLRLIDQEPGEQETSVVLDTDEDIDKSIDDLLESYDQPEQRTQLPSQSEPLEDPLEVPDPNLPPREQDDDSYFTRFFRNIGSIKDHQFTGPYTKLFDKLRDNVDPHSPLDALSLAHDINFSIAKNSEEEQAADDTYIGHVEKLLRNISSRNFGGRYDTMIDNIATVKRAFSWKKSSGINFLSDEQYRENEMRPEQILNNLKSLRDKIHGYSNRGKLRQMPMKDFTQKTKFGHTHDPEYEEATRTTVGELEEDSSDPGFTGHKADSDTDIDTSGLSDYHDPAAAAAEREAGQRPKKPTKRDPFIHSSLRKGDIFNPFAPPRGDATDTDTEPSDPSSGRPLRPRRRRRPPRGPGGQPPGADPAMEDVFNQREREKRIFLNNEALADDPESVHWLRPSYLKRYKQLQELNFYASQEHKEIEDYNDELIFDRHSGFGERTERSSKGLNMVNTMAERDFCLRFNLDPNAPFYNNKRFISKRDADVTFGKGEKYNYPFINQKFPLYTLPRDYSPAYELDNNSRINEGVSYDEYINAGLGHIYGSKKYDNYCNKMKNYPEPMKYYHTNYMDAPLKNQIDQTPQFPFDRKMFDKVQPIRKQGGDIPASIKCDEEVNRVGANIKDKTPEYNNWTDEYAEHYNRMYTKPRYNNIFFK